MKIRGNTVGTPIKPEKVVVKCQNLTEEEKAQARENIGAADAESLHNVEQISEQMKDAFATTSVNLFDASRVQNGYVDTKGYKGTESATYTRSHPIPVRNSVKYRYYEKLITNGKYCYCDKDGTFLVGKEATKETIDGVIYLTFTADRDGWVIVNTDRNNYKNFMFCEYDLYPDEYTPYGYIFLPYSVSPLYGKTAVFDGDSIGNGGSAGDGLNGWAGRIGANNAMTWQNYARGGGTITQIEGHYCIGGNIDTIRSNYPALDYLILEGGTNDADLLGEDGLGAFSATDYNGNYDTTTFSGAFETLLYKAVTYYPTAKIGYIVAHRMGTDASIRRKYFDRAVELCQKWGVPYIDLWNGSHLNRYLTAHYDSSLDSQGNIDAGKLYTDGQHLTSMGYEVITPKIEAWMKTL